MSYDTYMSNGQTISARIDGALLARMAHQESEAGIPKSEQIRRALGVWLATREDFQSKLKRSLMKRNGGKR